MFKYFYIRNIISRECEYLYHNVLIVILYVINKVVHIDHDTYRIVYCDAYRTVNIEPLHDLHLT